MPNPTSLLLLLVAAAHSPEPAPVRTVEATRNAAAQHRVEPPPTGAVRAQASGAAPIATPAVAPGHFTGLDHAELRRQLRQQYDERERERGKAKDKTGVNP